MKVLQLLFIENQTEAIKLYNEMFERLGEGIIPLVNGAYMQLLRDFRKGSMFYHRERSNEFVAENFIYL
jgi:hypothetical protein